MLDEGLYDTASQTFSRLVTSRLPNHLRGKILQEVAQKVFINTWQVQTILGWLKSSQRVWSETNIEDSEELEALRSFQIKGISADLRRITKEMIGPLEQHCKDAKPKADQEFLSRITLINNFFKSNNPDAANALFNNVNKYALSDYLDNTIKHFSQKLNDGVIKDAMGISINELTGIYRFYEC